DWDGALKGGAVTDQAQDIALTKRRNELLVLNRDLTESLGREIGQLVTASRAAIADSTARGRANIQHSSVTLAAVALGGVLLAVLIAWLYVGRNVVGRLVRLDQSMRHIADGELDTAVSTLGSDEIATMAKALEVFKERLIEKEHLAAKEHREQE